MKSKAVSLPYIIWMIAFTIIPLGMIVFFAFTTDNGNFTLDNISQIGQYMSIFLLSFKLAIIATVFCLLLGYPLAYLMSRAKPVSQRTMVMLLMLPMWMNFLLRTYAWMTILENNGLLNRFFGLFGLGPFKMINTEGAVILGMVYNYLPFMVLPLYTIMMKIDPSVIEAAQDLGANAFHVFARVIVPLSLPGIISGITMVFVPSVSTFIISKMLGGGSNMLIGDLIQEQFIGGSYNPRLGSAMSLILMVVIRLSWGLSTVWMMRTRRDCWYEKSALPPLFGADFPVFICSDRRHDCIFV